MNELETLEEQTLELLLNGHDLSDMPPLILRSLGSVEHYIRNLKKHFQVQTLVGIIVEAGRYNYLYSYLSSFREKGISITYNEVLSDVETLVLHQILMGKRHNEVAKDLEFTTKQVHYYKQKINEKWKVESNADLVIKAIQKNYLKLVLNSPVVDTNAERSLYELFHRGNIKKAKRLPKYKLQLSSPRKLFFQLSDEEKKVLHFTMEGNTLEEQTRLIGLPIRKLRGIRSKLLDKLSVLNRLEFVLMAIELGVVVIDNWQDYRMQTLSDQQKRFFLTAGTLSSSKSWNEMRVPGFTEGDAKEIYSNISMLWRKKTIEGILVDALRRGDFLIEELQNYLWSNFIQEPSQSNLAEGTS